MGVPAAQSLDIFDHLLIELLVILLADIPDVGSGQYVGQAAKRMIERQRLLGEHIQRRPARRPLLKASTSAASSTIGPRAVLTRRAVGFHPAQRLGIHQASAALAEHQVDGQNIGLFEQVAAC